jgi:CRISPR-associated endonuclease/helicase Cas3
VDGVEPDPIYGRAISNTWKWLYENATQDGEERRFIDFGVDRLGTQLSTIDDLSGFLAPVNQAPILLPSHLDLLCETAPTPAPEPDIALYLHGTHGIPEVRVVWRCDLSLQKSETWNETVALCPPSSGEMLTVPLWLFRKWLASVPAIDDAGDVEGILDDPADAVPPTRLCLLWRGRDRSKLVHGDEVGPGDVVIVPAAYGMESLGQSVANQAVGREMLDIWEPVRVNSGRPAALRLNRTVLAAWMECPPLKGLMEIAEAPTVDRDELTKAINALIAYVPESGIELPPSWWMERLQDVRGGRIEDHPASGIVLFSRGMAGSLRRAEPDLFADDDDLLSASDREVSLEDHSASVQRAAEKLARSCLTPTLYASLSKAAEWHDVGKLDARFQVMLHQGDEVAAASANAPLAKSATIPASPSQRRAIRQASNLPENFRHEMLSSQLAERCAQLPEGEIDVDLVLHLIASHHGYARPFAPIMEDSSPPTITGHLAGVPIEMSVAERTAMPPAHRIDSGVADRFWQVNRRYGWWGLAYLEAILRLADWYGSTYVIESKQEGKP